MPDLSLVAVMNHPYSMAETVFCPEMAYMLRFGSQEAVSYAPGKLFATLKHVALH
jgi:hypothetical protein